MYQKYHTEAIVLGSRESGEADRTVHLFTRDFGLVRAKGSALRTEKSKMRFALQHYSRSNVSLVKGKRGWRVAGATALTVAHGDPRGTATFARISELTMRLIHGEEASDYLYQALADAHDALMRPTVEAFPMIEIVCVARVLFSLGYISQEALQSTIFTHTAYADEHLQEAEQLKGELLASINRAIAETQL